MKPANTRVSLDLYYSPYHGIQQEEITVLCDCIGYVRNNPDQTMVLQSFKVIDIKVAHEPSMFHSHNNEFNEDIEDFIKEEHYEDILQAFYASY